MNLTPDSAKPPRLHTQSLLSNQFLRRLRWQIVSFSGGLTGFFFLLFGIFLGEQETISPITLLSMVILIILLEGIVLFFYIYIGTLIHPRATLALAQTEQGQQIQLGHDEMEVAEDVVPIRVLAEQQERLDVSKGQPVQNLPKEHVRQLISDAAHQLRTPLTSLYGFIQVLIRGVKDDPETTAHVLNLMKGETERMIRLVNDLILLARLSESPDLQLKELDLQSLIMECIEESNKLISSSQIILLQGATEDCSGVQGDSKRLKQAIQILLDNAIKYGLPEQDGKILIQLERREPNFYIHIIDNGKGILTEDIASIFSPFYRGQQIPTSSSGNIPIQGTGLGLSIALAIVCAHGGEIKVQSESNAGAMFTIMLPLANH